MAEGLARLNRGIALLQDAKKSLAKAVLLDEVKNIHDQAEAVRVYCKQARLGLENMNVAAEVKLRAERRGGELLASMPDFGRGKKSCKVQDFGINHTQSHRWQKIAAMPGPAFEAFLSESRSAGEEITTAAALSLAKSLTRTERRDGIAGSHNGHITNDLGALVATGGKFGCIYADPPWKYGNQRTRAATSDHYSTMTIAEICAMPVSEIAADKSHLHLWTTNGFLFDAKQVIEAWGFEYRSVFVWVKPQMGIGNYWRVSHEFLLLGIRGGLTFRNKAQKSWLESPRGKHSAKPEQIRGIIEKVSPGPYLELFGRSQVGGWTVFGNQIPKTLFSNGLRTPNEFVRHDASN